MAQQISKFDDVIDVRDVIARFEELETELLDAHEAGQFASSFDDWIANSCDDSTQVYEAFPENGHEVQESIEEFYKLQNLLSDIKGYGGDEQWRGDGYPITLIRDSYFTEAMQELCEDIGDVHKNLPSYIEIDWEATARNLRVDYSSVEFDGMTYWYR